MWLAFINNDGNWVADESKVKQCYSKKTTDEKIYSFNGLRFSVDYQCCHKPKIIDLTRIDMFFTLEYTALTLNNEVIFVINDGGLIS